MASGLRECPVDRNDGAPAVFSFPCSLHHLLLLFHFHHNQQSALNSFRRLAINTLHLSSTSTPSPLSTMGFESGTFFEKPQTSSTSHRHRHGRSCLQELLQLCGQRPEATETASDWEYRFSGSFRGICRIAGPLRSGEVSAAERPADFRLLLNHLSSSCMSLTYYFR